MMDVLKVTIVVTVVFVIVVYVMSFAISFVMNRAAPESCSKYSNVSLMTIPARCASYFGLPEGASK